MNYLFGPKAILEAVKNEYITIKKIYLNKNKSTFLIQHPILNKYQLEYVDDHFFAKYNTDFNHQDIIAEIESNNYFNSIEEFINSKQYINNMNQNKLILILDSIQDPRNFGSIIRTAYSLGAIAIIYKKDNQAQLNDYAKKTSMSACYFIPLIKVVNLSRTIDYLKKNEFWVYASNLSTQSLDYNTIDYADNSALIVGNENNGISDIVLKKSDLHIKIPMYNNFDSLNVSVATGILIANIIHKK